MRVKKKKIYIFLSAAAEGVEVEQSFSFGLAGMRHLCGQKLWRWRSFDVKIATSLISVKIKLNKKEGSVLERQIVQTKFLPNEKSLNKSLKRFPSFCLLSVCVCVCVCV